MEASEALEASSFAEMVDHANARDREDTDVIALGRWLEPEESNVIPLQPAKTREDHALDIARESQLKLAAKPLGTVEDGMDCLLEVHDQTEWLLNMGCPKHQHDKVRGLFYELRKRMRKLLGHPNASRLPEEMVLQWNLRLNDSARPPKRRRR